MASTRSRQRRELFLEQGTKLISRYGFRDVSVEEIARACSMSVGSFYKYFHGKEDFYEEILDRMEREGIRKADQIVSRLSSPVSKLKAVYRFIVLGVRQYPILRGLLIRDEKYLYPGFEARLRRGDGVRAHIENLLVEILKEGGRRGIFRTGLYNSASTMVISMLDTIIAHMDDPDVDDLISDILVLLQRGLRRVIRIRRRDERRDQRIIQEGEGPDWLDGE